MFTTFFNETDYFDQTLLSVLAQSFSDFEYLITTDGDPLVAAAIIARFPDPRVRLVEVARETLPRKRQHGLELARGEYIAMIDSDDVCEPERFERQMTFLRSHPHYVLVGSALRYIDERSATIGCRRYAVEDARIKKLLPVFNCIAQSAVIARRDAMLAAGGYDPHFRWGTEDYDLWLRMARHGRFHNLREALTAYRIHIRAAKKNFLKPALRDAIRLKIRAVRSDGFPLSLAVVVSIVVHSALLLLPSDWIWAAFKRLVVYRRATSLGLGSD